ncbi:taurine catabolism dioxygenase TauD [Colletotrichum limetticola]|uniref:Taurine catabolism dioxygenase TauD n=1 Tax=Colletotrichum limetticola TaxID=1209924 RepID=A0ABQ9P7F0_9PEZI|nr:taurine catabolism dioxygenase TauD [Colletotrichum limetticola]
MSTVSITPTAASTQGPWGRGLGLCSGQREPDYDLLQPFETMPEEISGSTVWVKEELSQNTGRWLYHFTEDQVKHVIAAVRDIENRGFQLSEVDKTTFELPSPFKDFLYRIRDQLINGIGFVVLRGLPVESWTTRQASIA